MVPQTETETGSGIKAGVKEYKLDCYNPDCQVKETDILVKGKNQTCLVMINKNKEDNNKDKNKNRGDNNKKDKQRLEGNKQRLEELFNLDDSKFYKEGMIRLEKQFDKVRYNYMRHLQFVEKLNQNLEYHKERLERVLDFDDSKY